ncbi:caspase domain-containing protein, partial [Gymnopilus junonius]
FVLLIGIDQYSSPQIPNLTGAVADALAMKTFLVEVIGVPPDHIHELYDNKASGENIRAAILGFADDERIHHDDSILIYYAGHGSEVSNPQPISMTSKVQMLIPHDFDESAVGFVTSQGILDFVFSEWLSKVAKSKGDRILVILDSCHSGSGTRTAEDHAIRGISLSKGFRLSTTYVTPMNEVADGQVRGSKAAYGFAKSGLESHVLLAACSEDQTAKEKNGRGLFTVALLSTLQRLGPSTCTYADLIQSLPDIGREQNPHCEGVHSDRLFLSGSTIARPVTVYKVTQHGTDFVIPAGDAVGIVPGAEFAVYGEKPHGQAPLGFLVALKVSTTATTLVQKPGVPEFTVPTSGHVVQIGSGPQIIMVNVAVQAELFGDLSLKDTLGPKIPPGLLIVDDLKCADLVLNKNDKGIGFDILDRSCTNYGLHHTSRSRHEELDDVLTLLQAASHFYFHLRRSSNHLLATRLNVECFEIYAPFHTSEGTLTSMGNYYDEEGTIPAYGFRITNCSQVPLFVAAFFFNTSDLSIKAYYRPPIPHSASEARPCLPSGASLTIGYGASRAIPREYYVDDGFEVDVGFLKIFSSTDYVDYVPLEQASPFEDKALRLLTQKPWVYRKPMWGSKVITIIQDKRYL